MSDLPFMTSKTLLPKRWQYSYLAFFAHGYSPRVHFAARSRFGPTALACCAGKRLRVSSAPHPCGFESLCDGPEKGKASIAGGLFNQVVGDEGCPRAASPPAFASSLRSSRAALENASRFLSFAPLRVRIPLRWARKRKGLHRWRPFQSSGGR